MRLTTLGFAALVAIAAASIRAEQRWLDRTVDPADEPPGLLLSDNAGYWSAPRRMGLSKLLNRIELPRRTEGRHLRFTASHPGTVYVDEVLASGGVELCEQQPEVIEPQIEGDDRRGVADAVPVDEVPLGETGRFAHLFRTGDTLGAATWATCVRNYDHHWKPAIRQFHDLTLACPKGSVDVLDMYWNARADAQWEAGKLRLQLAEEPVFIIDRSLGADEFAEVLRGARTTPPPLAASLALVPGDDDNVALAVTVTSNSEVDLRDVTLDLRTPQGARPMSEAAAWILPRPVATIADLPAGQSRQVALPTLLDSSAPFEDGQVRATLQTADGLETATDDWLWLVPGIAAQTAPEMDGKLDEWENRPAAWLSYDWAWARFGRDIAQLYEGGEHFSYPPYRLDARAAFWVAWDRENLYVAVRLEDYQAILEPAQGERIHLVIQPHGGTASELQITPTSQGAVEALLVAD